MSIDSGFSLKEVKVDVDSGKTVESPQVSLSQLLDNAATLFVTKKYYTAEPAYSYNVHSRFLAIVELNLVPFVFISLLFYPCYSRLLL